MPPNWGASSAVSGETFELYRLEPKQTEPKTYTSKNTIPYDITYHTYDIPGTMCIYNDFICWYRIFVVLLPGSMGVLPLDGLFLHSAWHMILFFVSDLFFYFFTGMYLLGCVFFCFFLCCAIFRGPVQSGS